MARAFIYFMKISGDFEGFEQRKNGCVEWLKDHPEYKSREIVIGESIENLFKKVNKDDVIVLHSIHFLGKLRYWSEMYDTAERSGARIVSILEKFDTFDKKSCLIMNIYTVFAQQEEERFREIEPELCDKCRELLS